MTFSLALAFLSTSLALAWRGNICNRDLKVCKRMSEWVCVYVCCIFPTFVGGSSFSVVKSRPTVATASSSISNKLNLHFHPKCDSCERTQTIFLLLVPFYTHCHHRHRRILIIFFLLLLARCTICYCCCVLRVQHRKCTIFFHYNAWASSCWCKLWPNAIISGALAAQDHTNRNKQRKKIKLTRITLTHTHTQCFIYTDLFRWNSRRVARQANGVMVRKESRNGEIHRAILQNFSADERVREREKK